MPGELARKVATLSALRAEKLVPAHILQALQLQVLQEMQTNARLLQAALIVLTQVNPSSQPERISPTHDRAAIILQSAARAFIARTSLHCAKRMARRLQRWARHRSARADSQFVADIHRQLALFSLAAIGFMCVSFFSRSFGCGATIFHPRDFFAAVVVVAFPLLWSIAWWQLRILGYSMHKHAGLALLTTVMTVAVVLRSYTLHTISAQATARGMHAWELSEQMANCGILLGLFPSPQWLRLVFPAATVIVFTGFTLCALVPYLKYDTPPAIYTLFPSDKSAALSLGSPALPIICAWCSCWLCAMALRRALQLERALTNVRHSHQLLDGRYLIGGLEAQRRNRASVRGKPTHARSRNSASVGGRPARGTPTFLNQAFQFLDFSCLLRHPAVARHLFFTEDQTAHFSLLGRLGPFFPTSARALQLARMVGVAAAFSDPLIKLARPIVQGVLIFVASAWWGESAPSMLNTLLSCGMDIDALDSGIWRATTGDTTVTWSLLAPWEPGPMSSLFETSDAFTEDIKSSGCCSHAQHGRLGEDTHAEGPPGKAAFTAVFLAASIPLSTRCRIAVLLLTIYLNAPRLELLAGTITVDLAMARLTSMTLGTATVSALLPQARPKHRIHASDSTTTVADGAPHSPYQAPLWTTYGAPQLRAPP
jgi:hypothetical protein